MRKSLKDGLLLTFLLLGWSACTTRLGVHLDHAERIESAEELLKAMREQGDMLESIRASGSVDMRRGRRRIKAHMSLAARRPSRLRFETESFFDQPLSILVSDGVVFSFWDLDKGRYVEGAATPVNISKVIPIFLDGVQVAKIMLGDPPLIPYATAGLGWDDAQGLYILKLSNARQRQVVKVHPIYLRPIRVTCWEQERLSYRLSYDRWETHSGTMGVPGKVSFEMPVEKVRLIMKIVQYERNPKLEDEIFVLEPPEGIPIENMNP